MDAPIAVIPIGSVDPLREPSLARELVRRFLVWDAFVAGRRRVDVHPLVLSAELHTSAASTAEAAVKAVGGVADFAHADAAERSRYGLAPDVLSLAAASRGAGDDASLMRVDLLLGESGRWQVCEINADCPGGHNEALGLPRLARAAGFARGVDPTHVVAEAVARLRGLAGSGGAVALVHATAYAEDLQVCALIGRELERGGTRAIRCSPAALALCGGQLCVQGEPVTALYRYFPAEWMTGHRSVEAIARAIESGHLRTLSSFAHVFTQSKLALARAWELAGSNGRDDTRQLIPETHEVGSVPRVELVSNRAGWVIKRAMGRVGDEVFVGALADDSAWCVLVDEVLARSSAGEPWVAQRFVTQRPVPTPWGDRLVTLGAYVLDGRFVGYFARVTEVSHASHDALCVPVFAEGAR
ncbi:MAG: glutathionylspermidine synthase family protein [Myxococcales bacterium]|nr:glutathionylspermidine synthase family protein [Myxococcales bacterium]